MNYKFLRLRDWGSFFFLAVLSLLLGHSVNAAPKAEITRLSFKAADFFATKNTKTSVDAEMKGLKDAELGKQPADCIRLAELAMKKRPEFHAWIFNTWSSCLARQMRDQTLGPADFNRYWTQFTGAKGDLMSSVAWKSIHPNLIKIVESYLDQLQSGSPQLLGPVVEKYFTIIEDRDAKSRAYLFSGDYANALHDFAAAKRFYQESLVLVDSREARDKLNTVKNHMGDTLATPEKIETKDVLSAGEQRFEDRFKELTRVKDHLSLVDDCVNYLNTFPNGKRSKWAFEKIQEVYNNLLDRLAEKAPVDGKYVAAQERIWNQLSKLDPSRTLDLIRWMHRKGDFEGGLRLGKVILPNYTTSPQGAILLYVMGRSAEFTGKYADAIGYFSQYASSHSNGDDIGEVQFRSGLCSLRMQDYSSAVSTFDRLLATKAGEKFELLSRYWLARSLTVLGDARASDEADKIITKYPLSYYALRLRSEKNQGFVEPFPNITDENKKSLQTDWSLLPSQKDEWERILKLAGSGWTSEAQSELSDLLLGPEAPEKIQIAKALVDVGLYAPAIRLINEALDAAPQFQVQEVISLGFPSPFEDSVRSNSAQNSVSPWLIFSLIRQESAFNEKATSVSKAMGLMQLIPPTALEVAQDLNIQNIDLPQDAYVAAVNIRLGTSYVAKMLRTFSGNVPFTLAAYNAGPQKVMSFAKSRDVVFRQIGTPSSAPFDEIWIDELPWSETSFYVKAILRNTILYRLKSGERLHLEPVLWSDLRLQTPAPK